MNKLIFIPTALVLSTFSAMAQTVAHAPKVDNVKTKNTELEALTQKNTLKAEKLKAELADTRAEISRLKLQRELLSEQQQIADLKQAEIEKAELKVAEDLKKKLERDAAIAKSRASLAASEL